MNLSTSNTFPATARSTRPTSTCVPTLPGSAADHLAEYDPAWTDEQVRAWDGNFRSDGELMLVCSERSVDVEEFRRVLEKHLRYRARRPIRPNGQGEVQPGWAALSRRYMSSQALARLIRAAGLSSMVFSVAATESAGWPTAANSRLCSRATKSATVIPSSSRDWIGWISRPRSWGRAARRPAVRRHEPNALPGCRTGAGREGRRRS